MEINRQQEPGTPATTMRQFEDVIRRSDGEGLRARWESGRYMQTLKRGKQLPAGLLAELSEKLDVSRSELGARMKFAARFPTEQELSVAVESCRTWSAIRRALTTTPRTRAADTRDSDVHDGQAQKHLKHATALVEEIDTAALDQRDLVLLAQLEAAIVRLKKGFQTLRQAVA